MADGADEPGPVTTGRPSADEPARDAAARPVRPIDLPEPQSQPVPPRWPGALKNAGIGLATLSVVVGGFAWSWWASRLPYPSRDQLQARTAASIGQQEHTAVAARCAEPDEDGASCQLRDREGRYGYSITTFRVEHDDWEGSGRLVQATSWDFPLDRRGRLEERFELKPPWDLATSITRTVLVATYALGPADLGTRVSCPGTRPGATVTCTATGQASAGQLRQLDAGHYLLTVTFTPPAGALAPPR